MKTLIIANWKMNPDSPREAKKIFGDLKRKNLKIKKLVPVICPPFIYLNEIAGGYRGGLFKFGAQDVYFKKSDQATGEISVEMLSEVGCDYVIIGHSERREIGESNLMIAHKVKHVIESGLNAVLCVGEKERDEQGKYLRFIEEQLYESLIKLDKKKVGRLIVVYEPVWAIGKGHHALDGHGIHQASLFIRKILVGLYGAKIGMKIPVLYGGSVDADNCHEIIKIGEVDGLLVGRASLNPHVFADILKKVG